MVAVIKEPSAQTTDWHCLESKVAKCMSALSGMKDFTRYFKLFLHQLFSQSKSFSRV